MVLSVACVSAANAAFISIDDFWQTGGAVGNLASASTYGVQNLESGAFGLSSLRKLTGQFWGTSANATTTTGTEGLNQRSRVEIGSGAMVMSYGGTKSAPSTWKNNDGTNGLFVDGSTVTAQTAQASWDVNGGTPANWFTLTSLSFDITNNSSHGTVNTPRLYLSMAYLIDPTDSQSQAYQTFDIALANRSVSLSRSSITAAGVNLSTMLSVSMYLTNIDQTTLSTFTGTGEGDMPYAGVYISNFGVSGVPAPGAVALLGAAGLVGARRRRA
jgi:hypothetical protein